MRNQRILVLNTGFGRSPTIVFEVGFVKSDSKIVSWYQLALLAAIANSKTSWAKKITARIKWNLKMDGLDRKMIFKFGRHIERLYSARKQGRRIYIVCICKQCVCLYKHHLRCKILVGNTQTLELHPVDADCAIASLIRSNLSQPYIIAHTPDQDVKCRSGHLHLRKQPLHDSFCTGHCSTLFISSW